jgi:crotonobetainyl-CoA:carnitine CoA-transferase CaiB-like acyl-CoA transferase
VHDHLWDGDVSADWIRSFQPGDYPVLMAANGDAIVISGHPAERGTFDRFVAMMGTPDVLGHPHFVTVGSRLAHLDEIVELLRAWAATCPDAAAIEAAADEQGLAMGVMRSVRDIADSDWAAETGAIVAVSDRSGGEVRVPNAPWIFSSGSPGVRGEPKFRGEDNVEVLRDLLGLDDVAIAVLTDDGVLSSRVPR